LAHQSALAGVVQIVEYVKQLAAMTEDGYPNLVRMPVLSPLPELCLFRHQREAAASCFCTDPDYVERWHEKWDRRRAQDGKRREGVRPGTS